MPKIFRRIRQHLLSQQKLGRYLVYAIGEIVLVVIGILLALQINTWNEERVTRQREIKFLGELRSNLERNMEIFRDFEVDQARMVEHMSRLIELKESSFPYQDSLAPYFEGIGYLEQITLVTSAYETMKAGGLDIISADSLRLKVIDLHEVSYAQLKELVREIGPILFTTRVQPFNGEHPEYADRYESRDLIYYLKGRIGWKNDLRYGISLLLERTEAVIDEIDAELAIQGR